MIKAIVCDLDGTLLNAKSHLWPESAHALLTLSRKGIIVILASGRSWRTVLRIQREIGINGPIIAHNGAYSYDSATDRDLYRHGVSLETARTFITWADHHQAMIRCYLGKPYPVLYNRYDLAHQLCWLRAEDRIWPELKDRLPTEPLEVFLSGLSIVDRLLDDFEPRGDHYELSIFPHVGYREVNLCAPDIDKVEALETVCRQIDISREDILAIGDGLNDVRMLLWAGHSVAIGDGRREAHEVAQFVTTPGHPEPVLQALQWALPDQWPSGKTLSMKR